MSATTTLRLERGQRARHMVVARTSAPGVYPVLIFGAHPASVEVALAEFTQAEQVVWLRRHIDDMTALVERLASAGVGVAS